MKSKQNKPLKTKFNLQEFRKKIFFDVNDSLLRLARKTSCISLIIIYNT